MYQIETKPLLIYDGDCGFCERSVNALKRIVGESIVCIAYQEIQAESIESRYAGISDAEFKKSVKLVIDFDIPNKDDYETEDGSPINDKRVYSAAAAIFRALAFNEEWAFLYSWYNQNQIFRSISEFIYNIVARNRKHITNCQITNA